jgi:hypothetical protein
VCRFDDLSHQQSDIPREWRELPGETARRDGWAVTGLPGGSQDEPLPVTEAPPLPVAANSGWRAAHRSSSPAPRIRLVIRGRLLGRDDFAHDLTFGASGGVMVPRRRQPMTWIVTGALHGSR